MAVHTNRTAGLVKIIQNERPEMGILKPVVTPDLTYSFSQMAVPKLTGSYIFSFLHSGHKHM